MLRRRRAPAFPTLLSALALVTAIPSLARAQELPPAPPSSYGVTVALDDVVLPLLAATEQDVAQGRPGLALARAQLVIETLPPGSALRVRAEGARLVAQQALGATPVEPVPPELLVEPAVTQAELDSQRGEHALAIARVDFALARVPAGSPLAVRATALRAAASRLMVQPAPQIVAAEPGVPYGYTPPPLVPVAAEAPPIETSPADPTRRGNAEAVELYITAAAYGVYLGFWVPYAAGLRTSSSSGGDDENLVYTLSMLGGGGVMALVVAGLDSGDGLRAGVGPSISMGIRYGLGMGFLMWGALDPFLSPTHGTCDPSGIKCTDGRAGMVERTALPMAFGLGGALLGAVLGYGTSPSTDDVRFVETSGIWGTGLGLLVAIAAAQDSAQGFGITAGGLGLGLLTTSIIAASGVEVSARRGWLCTLGFVIGAGAGTIVPALAAAGTGDFSVQIFGAVSAATSIAGLVTAFVLTDGMDERDRARRERSASFDPMRDLQLGAGPTEGGAVFTLSGRI